MLGLLDEDAQLRVESGHWFRGWYKRVLANPEVELVRDGESASYLVTGISYESEAG